MDTLYYWDDQVKTMWPVHVPRMKEIRGACRVLAWKPQQNLNRWDDLEDLDRDGKIILKIVAWKYMAWNLCFRIGTSYGFLWPLYSSSSSIRIPCLWKKGVIFWRRLRSTELINVSTTLRGKNPHSTLHRISQPLNDILKRKIWTSQAIIEPWPSSLQPVALFSYLTRLTGNFFYVHTKASCHCEIWFLHCYQLPR
jgi:hypothetical protein